MSNKKKSRTKTRYKKVKLVSRTNDYLTLTLHEYNHCKLRLINFYEEIVFYFSVYFSVKNWHLTQKQTYF